MNHLSKLVALEFVLFRTAMPFSAVFPALTEMVGSDTQASGRYHRVHDMLCVQGPVWLKECSAEHEVWVPVVVLSPVFLLITFLLGRRQALLHSHSFLG